MCEAIAETLPDRYCPLELEDAVSILIWSAFRWPAPHIVRRPGPISVVMNMAAFQIAVGGGCTDRETQERVHCAA
jgi:hypothetical protein